MTTVGHEQTYECCIYLDKRNPESHVEIGLIGKYVEYKDSYKSIAESFIHAGATNGIKVKISWIHSESIEEDNVEEILSGLNGILVAPGFGSRGIEGKISAIKYALRAETILVLKLWWDYNLCKNRGNRS